MMALILSVAALLSSFSFHFIFTLTRTCLLEERETEKHLKTSPLTSVSPLLCCGSVDRGSQTCTVSLLSGVMWYTAGPTKLSFALIRVLLTNPLELLMFAENTRNKHKFPQIVRKKQMLPKKKKEIGWISRKLDVCTNFQCLFLLVT